MTESAPIEHWRDLQVARGTSHGPFSAKDAYAIAKVYRRWPTNKFVTEVEYDEAVRLALNSPSR